MAVAVTVVKLVSAVAPVVATVVAMIQIIAAEFNSYFSWI
tara:strand:- start:532 stop:651 length:120 start_codon:yes stop_codon:yes gene_type:complete